MCVILLHWKKSRLRDEVRISHGWHVKLIHTACQARSQNLIPKFWSWSAVVVREKKERWFSNFEFIGSTIK